VYLSDSGIYKKKEINRPIPLPCSTVEPFDIHEILYDIIFGNLKVELLLPFSILSYPNP